MGYGFRWGHLLASLNAIDRKVPNLPSLSVTRISEMEMEVGETNSKIPIFCEKQFCVVVSWDQLHDGLFLQHKLGKIPNAGDHCDGDSIHLGNLLAGPDHDIRIIGQHNNVCVFRRSTW